MNRNLNLVYLGSLFLQIVQMSCFPILISQMLDADGVSGAVIGLLVAIPWLSVLLLGPLVPRLIIRLGNGATNLISSILSVIAILLVIISGEIWVVALSTTAMGAGLIIRWVNCDTLVIELSDDETSGRSIGIHEALMGLGLALGPLLFAIADLNTVKFACIIMVLLGQGSFLLVRYSPKSDELDETAPTNIRQFFRLISIALIAAFVAGFVESASTALFPLYFSQFDFTLSSSMVLASSFGFGGALLQPPLGVLADRIGYTLAQLGCSLAALAGCIVMVIWPYDYLILLVGLFFFGGAIGGLNTLAVLQAGKTLGEKLIPSAMTAIAMLYTLGGVVGPVASGTTLKMLNNHGMIIVFGAGALVLGVYLLVSASRAQRLAR